MKVEEIDALLGGEAQRLADQYRTVPLDFMDGYGWALTQICRLFPDETPVIRCKDCKHRDPEDKKCDCGHDIMWQLPRDDDWYCADAERKEECLNI